VCPVAGDGPQCPCLDPSDGTTCEAVACVSSPDDCTTFAFSTIAGCYCYDRLFGSDSGQNFITRVQDVKDADSDVCGPFLLSMSIAAGLSLVIAATTPFINACLVASSRALVAWERNLSDDVAATRLMFSVFRAQFVNTGVLTLLVYGRPPSDYTLPEPLPTLGVFDGDYDDFSRRWYSDAGARLVIAFVLAAIMPHLSPLFHHFVLARGRRVTAAVHVAHGHHKYAMQYDVNQNFVGPVFEFTTRYSYILTLLFVGYMYSGGIVIMPFLCLVFFCFTYWLDKLLLLRFYRRPPHRGDALQQRANAILPAALLLHLSFTIWAYGNPDLLESTIITETSAGYADGYANTVAKYEDQYGIFATRIVRANVFPLFLLWVVVAALCFVEAFGHVLPVHRWAARAVRAICCFCCRKKGGSRGARYGGAESAANRWTTEVAPYTDIYYKYIEKGGQLTTQEKVEGWMVSHLPDGTDVKKKGWSINDTTVQPTGRDAKFSWEVVADNGICTFRMEQVPGYAEIVAAIKEEERMYKADLNAAEDSDTTGSGSAEEDMAGEGTDGDGDDDDAET
ncbi:unnamed protein product, partial [Phaeothamnion confervicola]